MSKKVVIIGPESTGKTTLCNQLSTHYNCSSVSEFAREYLDKKNNKYTFEDVIEMAKGQQEWINNIDQNADLVILDTDLLVYKVWINEKYNKSVDWIENAINNFKPDIYLLCDVDIPWTYDPQREHPNIEDRKRLFEIYKNLLIECNHTFEIISGNNSQRFKKSENIITSLLKSN